MNSLILASTSPYRRNLMEKLGLDFICQSPICDENVLKASGLKAENLSQSLAQEKALSIFKQHPHATVIGSDQVIVFQGKLLDKPETTENAIAQLSAMSGKDHELITSICVLHKKETYTHTDFTQITLRQLSTEQISRYIQKDNPLNCAGSYKIESRGIILIDKIQTQDHTAIIGMPMLALTRILSKIGFTIP